MYYIASVTKAFTAISLAYTLEKQNKAGQNWSVDSKFKDILGDVFVLPSAHATEHATPKDALAHRLGLAGCALSYGGDGFGSKDLIRSLRHFPTLVEFRQEWHYLNAGYMLIQTVIQKLSGAWIGDVHREAIWRPLGMDITVAELNEALKLEKDGKTTLAHGYSYDPFTDAQGHQPWTDTELIVGGGIISSASDMAKWLRAFIEDGRGLPLSKESFESLTEPLMLETGPKISSISARASTPGDGILSTTVARK